MKYCIRCGAAASDEAASCPACGNAYGPAAPAPVLPPVVRDRPDGTVLIVMGWTGIGFGAFLFLIALAQASGRYRRRDFDDLVGGTIMTVLGSSLFHIGVLLLLVGLVIRAIWFLPGPDRKAKTPAPLPAPAPVAQPVTPAVVAPAPPPVTPPAPPPPPPTA